MEREFEHSVSGGGFPAGAHAEALSAAMHQMMSEHCRKIIFADLTADTFEELYVDGIFGQTDTCRTLSETLTRFAEGPFCHDNDRARFRGFTDVKALKAALEKADGKALSLIYRRKYHATDLLYSTVSLEAYPTGEENGHVTAVLVVQDMTENIQKYNVSLDENAQLVNHTAGRKTVLIVEDSELNREILTEILADEYDVLQAENGAVGLEMLQKYMLEISVVILDVQMPVMNGYEFLKVSRKDPFLSKIPVIVATGSNNAEEERDCLGLGASDFVAKPYNPEIIRSRIANIIRLKESVATMSMLQTDERTGLYTLQAFYYHVQRAIERAPQKDYSVIIFDIDRFKSLNEAYGEETGNRVLQQVAGCVKDYTAGSDINGRFGAARFLFLREKLPGENTEEWVRGLFDSLSHACEIKGIRFKAGIYDSIDKTLPVSAVCDRAITALNSVGHNIEKPFALYDEKHAALERRLAVMETDMWDAFRNEEFSVYYQPKHDVQTGKLVGAEALIRWIHPKFGFLSPGEFIPLFERNGFVTYADYYVLKRTCRNLRVWAEEGITPVPVSVNSSRRDFDRDNYLQLLMLPLRENGIDPSLIHIEVTESLFSDNLDNISRTLTECREQGLRIELDDFGSGYSSLTTLAVMPLDVMKLDMSFMRNFKNERKRKVLAACIALAKNLGLKTVCEGVELEEQRDLLREYGCDMIQGYYFSKPLPEREFREYLIRHQ